VEAARRFEPGVPVDCPAADAGPVRDLVTAKFGERYTVPGIWYLLRRRGWICQPGAHRAIERDDGAVEDLGKAHGLKKIQYPPGLIEGCLAGTGLAPEPG